MENKSKGREEKKENNEVEKKRERVKFTRIIKRGSK